MSRALTISVALAVIGCGASAPISTLRFYNRDPVWIVDDRAPIPAPRVREPETLTDEIDSLVRRQALHSMAVPDPIRAQNVNAVGEVPDSSWFTNRIGVREISPDELARGPNQRAPDLSAPLRLTQVRISDEKPRLIVEDASGIHYILKFDRRSAPEMETSPDVLVQRLLWAAGYNVPENSIVEFAPEQLLIEKGTKLEIAPGHERPLSVQKFQAALEQAGRAEDGVRLRALASRYLEGKPLGGYPMEGVRADDPNDRVPHQNRRDVRGLRLFYAWLGQTNVKEPNTLDMWVERPARSQRGVVTHYVLDFGMALGTWGDAGHEHDGYAPHFDWGYAFLSLVGLGLWPWPWEKLDPPRFRGVGRYQAAGFSPQHFSEANPYAPFLWTDRFDDYWAAKIIARFRPEHIEVAIEQAHYSDPDARHYLKATILARQRDVLRSAFGRVNPLDDFEVREGTGHRQLCFRDLMIEHGFTQVLGTRYELRAYDYEGDALPFSRTIAANEKGAICAGGLPTGGSHAEYTLVALWTRRGEEELAPVIVHLARHAKTGRLRVIGIERR